MFKPPDPLIGEQLPLEGRVADDVVITTNNGVFSMFSVVGVSPDTADAQHLSAWFAQFHNVLKNIQAEDVELFIYKCRGEVEPAAYPTPDHSGPFSLELDTTYREELFAGTLYTNALFLAVVVHAPNIAAQGISRFFSDDANPLVGIEGRRERIDEISLLLQAQLANFGLRRLGYEERDGVLYDEISEALAFAATGIDRQIPATTGRMGNTIFSEDLHFRRRHIEVEGADNPTYAVVYTFNDYPISTAPWMLEPLDLAPYRCTMVQSFRFLSNSAAGAVVSRKQNKMLIAGDKANDQIDALNQAHNRLLNREFVLGNHNLVRLAFADNRREISAVSNAAWRDLAACGIVGKRVSRNLQSAYLSIFPGNSYMAARPAFINSINFCALAPLYNWPQGERTGNWPGQEVALFRTLAGTPYRFHWNRDRGDTLLAGNTLFTGESGSGKTSLMAMLIALSAGRARIIALDHKRGWRRLFESLGGDYAVLGDGEPHIAPLKSLDSTPGNMAFLSELIRGLAGGIATEEDLRRLALGLPSVMQLLPPPERCLSELCAFFDTIPEGFGARLRKWCWPRGDLGWVVDAPRHTVSFSRLCCYDTTRLLNNPLAIGPALACIFHEISLVLDGTPTLIIVDEGWRALINPVFRGFVAEQLRMIRSKGGILAFGTQSPRDIIDSGIANLLIEQCPNAFHMANPRGRREDYVDATGWMTSGEFDAFHELQSGQGLFLLKQGSQSVVAQLPMDRPRLAPFLPILSAPEADLRALEIPQFKEAAE